MRHDDGCCKAGKKINQVKGNAFKNLLAISVSAVSKDIHFLFTLRIALRYRLKPLPSCHVWSV